ncbi:UNVERIFIED_CONTAM: Retrovirus-related Pol polyprotein from transposon RE1 [Sesamum radiatum]|uniref:Retrovirus-related Pol polyprotein from transposon RE1 n=1 Tax=Sesamum radiatum TaxID=300843 RepID=A0AAW2T586_SESRA
MEALKLVQNRGAQDPVQVHFARLDEMPGMSLQNNELLGKCSRTWIVDLGVTNHICGDVRLMHHITLPNPIHIHLPDNRISLATQSGEITLSPHFTLRNVLLVPSFKYNLFFVSQLCLTLPVSFIFLTSIFALQDLKNKSILAIGHRIGKLLCTGPKSFQASPIPAPVVQNDLRRSQRISKPPTWLHDFHCNLTSTPTVTPSDLTSSHTLFLVALEQNQTWEIVDLPPDKTAIGCKWVYKVKLKTDGSIECYKARLVAKGYNQVEVWIILTDFPLLPKLSLFKLFWLLLLVLIGIYNRWILTTRFFMVFLDEDIYMVPPEGSSIPAGKVWKLKRSLYGLKQASRQWNLELTNKLLSYGFIQSQYDHCLCLKHTAARLCALLVYVDDVLLTRSSESQIAEVKHFLDSTFTIKDLGPANYFLGLEIARSSSGPALISWKSKKQTTVARSTAEAEYRSMGTTACELQWISYMLHDFQLSVPTPIPLYCDNQAATHIVANPVFHERTKHLEIDCHLIRDKFKAGFLIPSYIPSRLQLADMFTKLLPRAVFSVALRKMGLVSFPQVHLEGG